MSSSAFASMTSYRPKRQHSRRPKLSRSSRPASRFVLKINMVVAGTVKSSVRFLMLKGELPESPLLPMTSPSASGQRRRWQRERSDSMLFVP